MGNLRKGTNLGEYFLAQIIVICGFAFSLIMIGKNWRKSPKSTNPRSSQIPNIPSIPADKAQTALDEKNKQAFVAPEVNHLTLTKFIEDNEKLINVLGIFTAITVFVSELRLQLFGYGLSFMFMTLTVILWLELWGRFPSGSGDWKIFWFENLMSLTVLALVIYWLIDFRDIWHEFLYLLIALLLLGLFSSTMKKFNIFNRLFNTQPGKLRGIRYLLGSVVLFLLFLASFQIAGVITPTINNFLDALNQSMNNSLP